MVYLGKNYTGKNVLVASIDSGVDMDDERLVGGSIQGFRLQLHATNHVIIDSNFHDLNGHGTEIAAAILKEAPECSLLIIRIRSGGEEPSPELILAGIEAAQKSGAQVINLSLSTSNMGKAMLLRDCCAMAQEAGSILVARGNSEGKRAYPADLPETVGVISDPECRSRSYFFEPHFFPRKDWRGRSGKFLLSGYSHQGEHDSAPKPSPKIDITALQYYSITVLS